MKLKPGLGIFYAIWPGNGYGLFCSFWDLHGASKWLVAKWPSWWLGVNCLRFCWRFSGYFCY